jgi:hypothetical protein
MCPFLLARRKQWSLCTCGHVLPRLECSYCCPRLLCGCLQLVLAILLRSRIWAASPASLHDLASEYLGLYDWRWLSEGMAACLVAGSAQELQHLCALVRFSSTIRNHSLSNRRCGWPGLMRPTRSTCLYLHRTTSVPGASRCQCR